MFKDIIEGQPTEDYRLRFRFEDGVEGEGDITDLIRFAGMFAPLNDRHELLMVRVHPEWGTIGWPNGADLDPDVLYAKVTGKEISVCPQQGSGEST